MLWKRKETGSAGNSSLVGNLQEVSGNTGNTSSPGGAGYPGPSLADLARMIKAVQDAKGPEKELILWKRKFAEDAESQAQKTWIQQ